MSFKKSNMIEDHLPYIVIINLLFTILCLVMISKKSIPQIKYLSSSKPDVKIRDLKLSICNEAFLGWQKNYVNEDIFSEEVTKQIGKSDQSYLSRNGIKAIYPSMRNDDICRAVFKRKNGFTAVDAVLTKADPFGYKITSIMPVKLTADDVRSFL